jgi:hypothetical protein
MTRTPKADLLENTLRSACDLSILICNISDLNETVQGQGHTVATDQARVDLYMTLELWQQKLVSTCAVDKPESVPHLSHLR